MKRKIIITSLMMASVLPFIGGMETARADEAQNLNEKAKSDLDQAQENLKAAQDEKENAEKDLAQANKDATDKKAKKENLENQLTAKQKELEENQKVLEKDKQIKKIDEEREALAPKIEKAKKDKEAAEENLNKAKSAHEEAEKHAANSNDFVKEGDPDGLKGKFEAADDILTQNQKRVEAIQKEKQTKIDKQYEFKDKKAGIQDFFNSIETDKSHSEKVKSQDYQNFKKKQEETYKKLDEEANKLQNGIDEYERALESIGDNIKEGQISRDEKDRAYRKYKQALNFQKDYKDNKVEGIRNLDDFAEKSKQRRDEAEKDLKEAKAQTEAAIEDYKSTKDEENNKKREIAKYKAAAQFLQDKLDENKDAFIINNRKFIEDEINAYKGLVEASEQILENIKTALDEKSENINNLKPALDTAQEHFDQSKWSYEIANEMKDFLEKKKNSNYDQKVKELKNKKAQAEADLAKKSKELDELTQKDDALALEKSKLDNISPSDIEDARKKIAENNEEIDRLKKEIKDIEESKELAKVKNLENKIKDLDKKISDINDQIQKLKNSKPGNQNKHEIPNLEKPSIENPIKEEESEDVWKGLSEMTLEKIDEQIRQKNIRTELKIHLNKYNKLMVAAQKYVEKFTLSRDKKMDMKSYDKLKMDIRVIKKIIDIIENLIKTGDLSDQERIDFVNIIKELKMNIDLVEKSLAQL